jgi:uncharacterized glyoxalase superfamily protein PhnB
MEERGAGRLRRVTVRSVTPILNVSDLAASLAWFEKLGWETRFVWRDDDDAAEKPGFAAVGVGENEIFLAVGGQGSRGTHPSEHPFDTSTGGVWMWWSLDGARDVDAMHVRAVELGLDISMPPTDEPWGVREFHLRHPDGHTIRVGGSRGR